MYRGESVFYVENGERVEKVELPGFFFLPSNPCLLLYENNNIAAVVFFLSKTTSNNYIGPLQRFQCQCYSLLLFS
jgi:hypothetical protein